jgi:hypothetical protein
MAKQFASDPICERYSGVFGTVRLYPPLAPPAEWKDLPWLIETEWGGLGDDPIREKVKASLAFRAYGSPSIIDVTVRFQ